MRHHPDREGTWRSERWFPDAFFSDKVTSFYVVSGVKCIWFVYTAFTSTCTVLIFTLHVHKLNDF